MLPFLQIIRAIVLTAVPDPFTVTVTMKRKKSSAGSRITVYWDNPPGPRQGVTIDRLVRGNVYTREVGSSGVLTPPEVASALQVTREFVYRLIWDKKLKTITRRGQMVIPLTSVKAYMVRRDERRRKRTL